MSGALSTTRAHERIELRTARRKHDCWTHRDSSGRAPGEGWDGNPRCGGVIREGERYVLSTIFPGHDSGYADGGWDRHGNPIGPHPVTSKFCMPCARRWRNIADGLARIEASR